MLLLKDETKRFMNNVVFCRLDGESKLYLSTFTGPGAPFKCSEEDYLTMLQQVAKVKNEDDVSIQYVDTVDRVDIVHYVDHRDLPDLATWVYRESRPWEFFRNLEHLGFIDDPCGSTILFLIGISLLVTAMFFV